MLPPAFGWWREVAGSLIAALCAHAESMQASGKLELPAEPDETQLDAWLQSAPLMSGAEYLNAPVLRALWRELGGAFELELRESRLALSEFIKQLDPAWNVVGRVHFNLAENRRDSEAPFAFLATYSPRLGASGKAQHQPLGQALKEYAGAANKDRLLSLLLPVQRAAEHCEWLRAMIAAGELFHPLRWSPQEALSLLRDVPALEAAGVIVRMPANWSGGRPARPRVSGTVGSKVLAGIGTGRAAGFPRAVDARRRAAHEC